MSEISKIGSNLPTSQSSASGAEQLMDILRDSTVGKEELPEKLKETLLNLPESESNALKDRIKNNDEDDPLAQLIRGSLNKADAKDLVETFDSKIPSVPLGGRKGKDLGKNSDIPSVPLGGGKVPVKEPDIPSVPLGGRGNKRVSDPPAEKLDLPSIPLGGKDRNKIEKDSGYPSVPLGGGKVDVKEPDRSVPLGGNRKADAERFGQFQQQNLRDLLPPDDKKTK
jgi:hypothetical protein